MAAVFKRKQICPSNPDMLHGNQNNGPNSNIIGISSDSADRLKHTQRFRYFLMFLNNFIQNLNTIMNLKFTL